MSLIGPNGQVFGWSESTWLLLDRGDTLLGLISGVVMFVLGIIGWFQRNRIRLWLLRNRFPHVGGAEKAWEALVFTVSRSELPQWVIARLEPSVVGLVASKQSQEAAAAVRHEVERRGIRVLGVRIVSDPDDPAETRDAVASLLAKAKESASGPVAVDVTGGKTPMSLGAFMAAEEAGADSIYVSSRFDEKLRQPDSSTSRIVVLTRHPRD